MKLFGIAGYSGSGKTTLLEKLLPRLVACGLRVSVLKHAHHDFDIDIPGKDSYRHRQAGASEVLIAGSARWALLHELRVAPPPALAEHVARLSPCDLVLVEGFKDASIPKLEVYRPANGKPPLWPDNPTIIAVAGDRTPPGGFPAAPVWLDLNDADSIVRFILISVELEEKARVVL
ncbi:MAG TPA: molybdopterin-guanine dinucleotide biosynthesis protein B [Accumulibacter sp.]|jgi:molybdopterin-guanine dinucleotide biosynthesis protein B|nr:molybdopterin-guanine dinucleotide biosynthesis protein B [Accumulibacter sp.]HQC79285.1 molybdopterin-guanine dinucleotide biosynthesis protein B [Accumulibacter sp.]